MESNVIVEDIAWTADADNLAALSRNDNIVISTLREFGELEAVSANGFAAADEASKAIVTIDARFAWLAGGTRRFADIALLMRWSRIGSGHFPRMAAPTRLHTDAVLQHDMIGHAIRSADAIVQTPYRITSIRRVYKRKGQNHAKLAGVQYRSET